MRKSSFHAHKHTLGASPGAILRTIGVGHCANKGNGDGTPWRICIGSAVGDYWRYVEGVRKGVNKLDPLLVVEKK